MDVENIITLVTVCDNHFAVLLAALIKSIEVNHRSSEPIHLYIVDDNISEDNKDKLINSADSNLITVHWRKMQDIIPAGVYLPLDNSSFPLNIYARLFIPYFIPKEAKKVIYLDVDMIVLEDISKLWHLDIGDHVVAGVVDRSEVVSSSWGGIKNYQELGLPAETKYYNSGLLVINPVNWRELDLTNKIISCVEVNKKFANFPDQYGLNVVFANQWFELDSRWNCYSISKEKSPFIIHFIGRKPIYKSYNLNEQYRDIFYSYLHLTKWKAYKPISESKRLTKKFYNLGVKKLLRVFSS